MHSAWGNLPAIVTTTTARQRNSPPNTAHALQRGSSEAAHCWRSSWRGMTLPSAPVMPRSPRGLALTVRLRVFLGDCNQTSYSKRATAPSVKWIWGTSVRVFPVREIHRNRSLRPKMPLHQRGMGELAFPLLAYAPRLLSSLSFTRIAFTQ